MFWWCCIALRYSSCYYKLDDTIWCFGGLTTGNTYTRYVQRSNIITIPDSTTTSVPVSTGGGVQCEVGDYCCHVHDDKTDNGSTNVMEKQIYQLIGIIIVSVVLITILVNCCILKLKDWSKDGMERLWHKMKDF